MIKSISCNSNRIAATAFFSSIIVISILIFGWTTVSAQGNKIVISDDLLLKKLSENAYIHTSYMYIPGYNRVPANGLIYVNSGKAVIIDTPWNDTMTKALVFWVRKNLDVEIESVIATHWHNDCMGGMKEIHRLGIKTYSLNLTREIAAQEKLPVPEYGFDTDFTMKIGGAEIMSTYFGAGHTVDNIVVWVPDEKILFGGCLVKTLGARGLGNIREADLDAWQESLENVLKSYPGAKIVIPGHGPHGGIQLIRHTIELLQSAE